MWSTKLNEMFRLGLEYQEHSVNFVTTVDVDWGNLGPSGVETTGSIADSFSLFGEKNSQRGKSKKHKNRVSPLARERRCHGSSRRERSIGVGGVVYKVERNVPSWS